MRGPQVRAARELLGMSQQDLAARADMSVSTVRDIENGTGDPRRSSIEAIEDFLISQGIRFVQTPGVIGMPLTNSRGQASATDDPDD